MFPVPADMPISCCEKFSRRRSMGGGKINDKTAQIGLHQRPVFVTKPLPKVGKATTGKAEKANYGYLILILGVFR